MVTLKPQLYTYSLVRQIPDWVINSDKEGVAEKREYSLTWKGPISNAGSVISKYRHIT